MLETFKERLVLLGEPLEITDKEIDVIVFDLYLQSVEKIGKVSVFVLLQAIDASKKKR